jgi:hypothetical protein
MKENHTAFDNVLLMIGMLAAILVTIGTVGASFTQLASAQNISIPTNNTQQANCDTAGSSSAIADSCNNNFTNNIANSGGVIDLTHHEQQPPQPQTGTITVTKHVINDNGGTLQASDFTIEIHTFADPFPLYSFPGSESGFTARLLAGPDGFYEVREITDVSSLGYSISFAGDCRGPAGENSIIHLNPGDHKTCTITNNDNP